MEITGKTRKRLDEALKNPVSTYLKSKETHHQFNVGDVLIKKELRGDEWRIEKISYDSVLDQRYVYIHEDEHGIGYLAKLKVSNGKLGDEVFCMATDFNFNGLKFEVDPEYAESTFLGADYSLKDIHNKAMAHRKIATSMNRKLGKKCTDLNQVREFFKDMKQGDVFYSTDNYTGRKITTYTFKSIKDVAIAKIDNHWEAKTIREKYPNEAYIPYVTYDRLSSWGSNYPNEGQYMTYFIHDILYKSKPATEEGTGG